MGCHKSFLAIQCPADLPSLQPHQFSYSASGAAGVTTAATALPPAGSSSAVAFAEAKLTVTVPSACCSALSPQGEPSHCAVAPPGARPGSMRSWLCPVAVDRMCTKEVTPCLRAAEIRKPPSASSSWKLIGGADAGTPAKTLTWPAARSVTSMESCRAEAMANGVSPVGSPQGPCLPTSELPFSLLHPSPSVDARQKS